jgi:nitrous oxide reductase accessory protein NosL
LLVGLDCRDKSLDARFAKDFITVSKGGNMEQKRAFVGVVSVLVVIFFTIVAFAQDDIRKSASCKYCGMDRQKFSQSRMLITYDDGTEVGTCSIHCLAVDLAMNIDKTPVKMQVGDAATKTLIDAEKAFWVVGGDMMGVMTKRGKWAFEKQPDRDAFVKAHGGQPATFEEAMKASYEDMYADTKMIREKRKMKMMHGK